jgi:hypothetical protein
MAARRLLYDGDMPQPLRQPDDFTLRIVVTAPERQAPPNEKTGRWQPDLATDEQAPTRPFKKTLHVADLAPPPVKTKPEPLSQDDHARVLRRARAFKKIAWARQMLRKFGFEEVG